MTRNTLKHEPEHVSKRKMSRFEICVTIIDTPEESGNDPTSVNEDSKSESEFLYGYFDKSLFEEPVIEEPLRPKITRIIQSDINAKEEILACLRDFIAEDDIVQIEIINNDQIRFIVDMSSEECVLLNLASSAPSMTINDVLDDGPDTSHE